MKTQHTPGPWKLKKSWVEVGGEFSTFAVTQDNGDRQGLYIASVQRDINGGEANARLIAAAPALLEALLELTAHVKSCEATWLADGGERDTKMHGLAVCLNNRAGDLIKAAIAQATGGEQ